jgi:hypothetical protein
VWAWRAWWAIDDVTSAWQERDVPSVPARGTGPRYIDHVLPIINKQTYHTVHELYVLRKSVQPASPPQTYSTWVVTDDISVVRDTLKIQLTVVIDSEGWAVSHSQASDTRGFSIKMVYIVLLLKLLCTAMVEVLFVNSW